jgi:hypothetical protein
MEFKFITTTKGNKEKKEIKYVLFSKTNPDAIKFDTKILSQIIYLELR